MIRSAKYKDNMMTMETAFTEVAGEQNWTQKTTDENIKQSHKIQHVVDT